MNLLRHMHLGRRVLKLNNLQQFSVMPCSISHVDSTNNRFRATNVSTNSGKYLIPHLQNGNHIPIRFNHQTLAPRSSPLETLLNNVNPYKRLVRLDRPIGKLK